MGRFDLSLNPAASLPFKSHYEPTSHTHALTVSTIYQGNMEVSSTLAYSCYSYKAFATTLLNTAFAATSVSSIPIMLGSLS